MTIDLRHALAFALALFLACAIFLDQAGAQEHRANYLWGYCPTCKGETRGEAWKKAGYMGYFCTRKCAEDFSQTIKTPYPWYWKLSPLIIIGAVVGWFVMKAKAKPKPVNLGGLGGGSRLNPRS